jgi:hypothetical protein
VDNFARARELDGAVRVEAWIALYSMHPERHRADTVHALLARSVPASRLVNPAAGWTEPQIATLRSFIDRSS